WHAREGREGLCDRLVLDPGRACRDRRGGGILAVVRARNPGLGREHVVEAELAALGAPGDRAEASRHDRDVVLSLVLEDAQLGVGVALEGAMTIEVIGLEVEQDADPRSKRRDVL